MSDIGLRIIPSNAPVAKPVDYNRIPKPIKHYEAPKVNLSANISSFDNRKRTQVDLTKIPGQNYKYERNEIDPGGGKTVQVEKTRLVDLPKYKAQEVTYKKEVREAPDSFKLRVIDYKNEQIPVSLKNEKKVNTQNFKVDKVELSKNIQRFDRKPRVYTQNPYSFNSVSLRKDKPSITPNQSASDMIINPTYNTLGKFLGVDTLHDWERYYDKVYAITEWAKTKSGKDEPSDLMGWISEQVRSMPNMGMKEIDSLYLRAKLFLNK